MAALLIERRDGRLRWAAGIDPFRCVLLGLTFTGYFLVLWPLSYLNHALVAKAWDAARGQ
jgi:hypothetical protein